MAAVMFRSSLVYMAGIASLFSFSVSAGLRSTPMRIYSQAPYQSTVLTTQLRSAFTPESSELFAIGTVASIWARNEDYQLDYYQNQVFAGIQWALSPRWTAEFQYQFGWAGNNHLDSLTIDFHDFFGLDQNGRDEVDKHQFTIANERYGIQVSDFEDEVVVRALHGYLQYRLWQQPNHALALGASLYYNDVDDYPFTTHSFEQGLQLNYSYQSGAHAWFSTVGVTHRKPDRMILNSLPSKAYSWAVAMGYGYRFWTRHEVLLEYHGYEGILDDDSDLSDVTNEVILGYRYYFDRLLVEFSATENVFNMDNSTDIAFSLGLRYHFSPSG